MVKIFKPILLVFIKSKAMKRLIIDLLKAIAKETDNTLDDQAVRFINTRRIGLKIFTIVIYVLLPKHSENASIRQDTTLLWQNKRKKKLFR